MVKSVAASQEVLETPIACIPFRFFAEFTKRTSLVHTQTVESFPVDYNIVF